MILFILITFCTFLTNASPQYYYIGQPAVFHIPTTYNAFPQQFSTFHGNPHYNQFRTVPAPLPPPVTTTPAPALQRNYFAQNDAEYRGFAYQTRTDNGATSHVVFVTGPQAQQVNSRIFNNFNSQVFGPSSNQARTVASEMIDPVQKTEETQNVLPKNIQDIYSPPAMQRVENNDPFQFFQSVFRNNQNPSTRLINFYSRNTDLFATQVPGYPANVAPLPQNAINPRSLHIDYNNNITESTTEKQANEDKKTENEVAAESVITNTRFKLNNIEDVNQSSSSNIDSSSEKLGSTNISLEGSTLPGISSSINMERSSESVPSSILGASDISTSENMDSLSENSVSGTISGRSSMSTSESSSERSVVPTTVILGSSTGFSGSSVNSSERLASTQWVLESVTPSILTSLPTTSTSSSLSSSVVQSTIKLKSYNKWSPTSAIIKKNSSALNGRFSDRKTLSRSAFSTTLPISMTVGDLLTQRSGTQPATLAEVSVLAKDTPSSELSESTSESILALKSSIPESLLMTNLTSTLGVNIHPSGTADDNQTAQDLISGVISHTPVSADRVTENISKSGFLTNAMHGVMQSIAAKITSSGSDAGSDVSTSYSTGATSDSDDAASDVSTKYSSGAPSRSDEAASDVSSTFSTDTFSDSGDAASDVSTTFSNDTSSGSDDAASDVSTKNSSGASSRSDEAASDVSTTFSTGTSSIVYQIISDLGSNTTTENTVDQTTEQLQLTTNSDNAISLSATTTTFKTFEDHAQISLAEITTQLTEDSDVATSSITGDSKEENSTTENISITTDVLMTTTRQ